jgi:hypothetical protein
VLTPDARAAAVETAERAANSGHWQAATGALVADVLDGLRSEIAALRALIEARQ